MSFSLHDARSGAGIMEADDRQVMTVSNCHTTIGTQQTGIMKCYHRQRMCSHTSPCSSRTMVTLHDTRFVKCQWWNDGWAVKTVII